jgi:hypothetical protein
LEDLGHHFVDTGPGQPPVEEGLDGDLVGGTAGAAPPARPAA